MRISDWSSDVCSSDLFFSLRSIEDENRRFDLLRDGFVHELRASKIVKRQSTNVFIERDGNFGMYRLRPQPKGLRLLYTLDPPNRSSEARRGGQECVSPCRSRWSPYQ